LHQAIALQDTNSGLQGVIRMLNIPKEKEHISNGFQWSNCGSSSEAGQVKNLTLSPDPVKLPGNITVSVGAELGVDLVAPIQLSLTLKKHIGFWITIPCVDNIGSCTYDDACALLANITCPPGVECHCPISHGSYYFPPMTLPVTLPPDVPSWLESGDYQVTAVLKARGKELACVHLQVALSN